MKIICGSAGGQNGERSIGKTSETGVGQRQWCKTSNLTLTYPSLLSLRLTMAELRVFIRYRSARLSPSLKLLTSRRQQVLPRS